MKAIIIGAGIAGIATAIRLAAQGFNVQVFEANAYMGGKLTALEKDGFRFDAGPSLFTLPALVDELFTIAGQNPQDYFRYQKLTEITRYFWPDGTRLTAFADQEKFFTELEEKLRVPKNKAREFFNKSARIYNATADTFLNKSLHKTSTYLSKDVLKTLFAVRDLGLMQTMHGANSTAFSNAKFVQLLNRFATYNGSNPYAAPATLNIIPHLEHGIGAFYPDGGMHSITQSLVKLAKELGVIFRMEEPVKRILVHGKKATGVETSHGKYKADIVISNADVYPTYKNLLPGCPAPQKTLEQPKSSSALIFYWGINRQFPELDLHNIFFSQDYKHEFDCIFNRQTISHDPTVYINITSKLTPAHAPAGSENWFVMVNVPANTGQNWDELINQTRENVLAKLTAQLQTKIRANIVSETILDPRSIEAKTSSHLGALYGAASNNRFAAFLRHPNFSSHIRGLYFCGGSVHPGGGIPLCLLSAKIVAGLVQQDGA